MKFLAISTALAVIPLIGVLYIIVILTDLPNLSGFLFTTDGLFMVIMLLTISGIFGLNATLEARDLGLIPFWKPSPESAAAITAALPPGVHIQTGTVQELHFFESGVGGQNKTVAEFADEATGSSRYISFLGNVKDQLPLGARIRITYRVDEEGVVLLGRDRLFGFRFGKSKSAAAGSSETA